MGRIICDPEVLGGKPVVAGTRLSVAHILGLISSGMTILEVCEAYPELTQQDVQLAVGYAARMLANDVVIDLEPDLRSAG